MFDAAKLPTFTFIGEDGGETNLCLRDAGPRIRAIAAELERRVVRGSVVGLLYSSEPNLVLNWLACLLAGLEPLVMQYPSRKQSRDYWAKSVQNTIATASVAAVLVDTYCGELNVAEFVSTIPQLDLDALEDGAAEPWRIDEFAILQLSSGTTGHRKGVRFTSEALGRHVTDYNASLALTAGKDRIVSWLPLYHDMGYIACFVMPLALGIDVVMIDPLTWVRQPELLFDAIERHAGTICYMPNFGFELLARREPRALPTMRWWISCSEPISPDTARKFLATTGASEESFAPCYAMAENIFAVTIRRGLLTREIEGVEVSSCGGPIQGVELKIVDSEVWVRSPTSLSAYIGGVDIRDGDGFYPTGDLGEIHAGELFVTGRKQDLMIQAGRKFMLSDIDLALNRLRPDVRGRAVAVQVYDPRLGTQKAVVLIEATDFIERADQAEVAEALKSEMNLDQIDVDYVPPRFLTKTSSGKFNRKLSAHHWELAKAAQVSRRAGSVDPLAELRSSFPMADWSVPADKTLDSLSLTVLRIILNSAAIRFDIGKSLDDYAAAFEAAKGEAPPPTTDVIKIVSLADRHAMADITEKELARLSEAWGAPVSYEHVCLPPSPILLSDLVFHDWFQPRLDQTPFSAIDQTFDKLRNASLIIMDDRADMSFPPRQVYSVLSHNFERSPDADLVTVRWQRYSAHHDELPLTVATGADLSLEARGQVYKLLSRALGRPLFRIAQFIGFDKFTRDWEFRPLAAGLERGRAKTSADALVDRLIEWVASRAQPLERFPGRAENSVDLSDLAHYCSYFASRENVLKVIDRYQSFVIVGQRASAPFVRTEIEKRGKAYQYANSFAPEVLGALPEPFDCVLLCGAMGEFQVDGPAFAVMHNGANWKVSGVDTKDELSKLTLMVGRRDVPATGTDWYYPIVLEEGSARQDAKHIVTSKRDKREEWINAALDFLEFEPELELADLVDIIFEDGDDRSDLKRRLRPLFVENLDGTFKRREGPPPAKLVGAMNRRKQGAASLNASETPTEKAKRFSPEQSRKRKGRQVANRARAVEGTDTTSAQSSE